MKTKIIENFGGRLVLQILVQPRSSKNSWGKVLPSGEIQLKLTAPPIDGAANNACLKFLAKEFKTAKSNIEILSGGRSRHKKVEISLFDQDKLNRFITKYL
jgi:uncharacterized protein (TIGR00251 family)